MSIFTKLFGNNKSKSQQIVEARDICELVKPLSHSALHLVKTTAVSKSYFGGLPSMPDNMSWPTHNGRSMAHLATFSLEDIRSSHEIAWLPAHGTLIFFYDIDEQPWGFDPKDEGGWKVIYLSPDQLERIEHQAPDDLSDDYVLPVKYIDFNLINSYPGWEREGVDELALTEDEFEQLIELQTKVYDDESQHQIAGFPNPMQNDQMELECQLVTNGLYCGDATGYEDSRAKELKKGAEEWRLLFQMDSDDDLDIMWGDAGLIYFWIREQDALDMHFEKTWLILQCG